MAKYPEIYRLLSIIRLPHPWGGQHVKAEVYCHPFRCSVEWWDKVTDPHLTVGCLVKVFGKIIEVEGYGPILLGKLVRVEQAVSGINLFETVPDRWGVSPMLLSEAKQQINKLPTLVRHVFNQVFWEHKRLEHFLTGGGLAGWLDEAKNTARSITNPSEGLARMLLWAAANQGGGVPTVRQALLWLAEAGMHNAGLSGKALAELTWLLVQGQNHQRKPKQPKLRLVLNP
ncbi:hypothetical protein OTERR_30570 [Oryzomicrobium terrae]|uniref:Uncharacterized protein n=1 Tax=Oryzomicrobium terrae TaxID=1735038 RepID=A0A5C1ECB1_9RHOO|nr:hypothetical protein [Oryzomicrobium terrae]QEL66533.1 hypothetical protein OTERR_30570 [Oryzomicrobium terrae]